MSGENRAEFVKPVHTDVGSTEFEIHDDDLVYLYELLACRPDRFDLHTEEDDDRDVTVVFQTPIYRTEVTVMITDVQRKGTELYALVSPYQDRELSSQVDKAYLLLGAFTSFRTQEAGFLANMKRVLPYVLLRITAKGNGDDTE